jgi:hypothetical protein
MWNLFSFGLSLNTAVVGKLKKMRISIIIFLMATTGIFSWGQDTKSSPNIIYKESSYSAELAQSQKLWTNQTEKYIDTKFRYRDSTGMSLIIQNSLPKGGLKYTDPNGKEYGYAIFWNRIYNEGTDPIELTIDFPEALYELPSAPGVYFNILLPPAIMTPDKERLFNYGLTDLKAFLDSGFQKFSSLKRTIRPKESTTFYVLTLANNGVEGTLRTGLSLREQNLFYRINDKEIPCGKISSKGLALRK